MVKQVARRPRQKVSGEWKEISVHEYREVAREG